MVAGELFHSIDGIDFHRFTEWVVRKNLLVTPFVLIDIGVNGGIHPRWMALKGCLDVYGFDALEEAISPLSALGKPGHHYFSMALGNEDGERDIHVQSDTYSSSLYEKGDSRYDIESGVQTISTARRIPIHKLDTLYG
jgi:FkbM family methyltransferase